MPPAADRTLPATGLLAALGATIPVVAAPMGGGPSTPALVAAATAAGALGFLAAGYRTVDQLAGQVADVRARTGLFGVNLFVPNPVPVSPERYAAYAAALRPVGERYGLDPTATPIEEDDDDWPAKLGYLLAHPVPVVSFTFGIAPAEAVERLRRAGSRTVQTVTTVGEARRAARAGVDALVAQGHLAGAHSATTTPERLPEPVALTDLVAAIRAAVDLPVWAAGGLGTADDVRAVLAAGAEAAAVGTVLLRSAESGASQPHKDALAERARLDPADDESVLTRAFSGRPARALRNGFLDRFGPLAPTGYPAIHHLTSPLRKAAAAAGDVEGINIWAGAGFRHATTESATTILRRLAAAPGTADSPAGAAGGPHRRATS